MILASGAVTVHTIIVLLVCATALVLSSVIIDPHERPARPLTAAMAGFVMGEGSGIFYFF